MRSVRVALPFAIMLGLAGSTSAFLQNVRPTHLVVPAHKYQAAVTRARCGVRSSSASPRVARSMRVMSATVDVEAADTTAIAGDEVVAPAAPVELEAAADAEGDSMILGAEVR